MTFFGYGMNIFIRKLMIARCLMPILVWFYEIWFFETSTSTPYQRCGSQANACQEKRYRLFLLSMFEAKNIKKLEIDFYRLFFYLRLTEKNLIFGVKWPVISKPVTGIALKMRKSGPRSKIRSRNMFGWSILWLSFLTLDSRAGP